MNKKVYIILLNYRGYDDTTACIRSLRKIDYTHYKIIVIDNFSGDGSFEKLRDENKDCILIQADANNGFSAGNNIGIHYAMEHDADYIMLLNNDTEVKSDFLSKMIGVADDDTVITPSIYFYSNPSEVWYAAGKINYNRCTVSNDGDEKSKYCDYASGCCLLIPRKVIERVGYWAEEYFMYYEDMDYSIRIIREGFKIFYNKDAVVYHKVGKSAGIGSRLSIYYNIWNRLYIINKFNFGIKSVLFTIVSRVIRYIESYFKHNNNKICLKAITDYYMGRRCELKFLKE